MSNRTTLINNLKTSIKRLNVFSCPDFENVYSNQYFHGIIKKIIPNYENTYSVIFGDFNKLGYINDTYGSKFGDYALSTSMKIISDTLPSNAMIVRVGGDEFYIIIPNCDKETSSNYCNEINENLAKNASLLQGLSIELACSDSTYGDFDKQVEINEETVSIKKSARKNVGSRIEVSSDDFLPLSKPTSISEEENYSWDELNRQVNISIYNFLQNFRPSKTLNFEKEQITDASTLITTVFAYALTKNIGFTPSFAKQYEYLDNQDYLVEEDIEYYKPLSHITPHEAEIIHSLRTAPDSVDIDSFSDMDIEKINFLINDLMENLIRGKNQLFTKHYFNNFSAEQIINAKVPLAITAVTTCGVKLSNLAYGFSFTDGRLHRTNEIFSDEINRRLSYKNTPFEFDANDIHIISMRSGDYLFIYPRVYSK